MSQFFVWTKHYRWYGQRRNHRSSKMFPVSYGPFDSVENAEKWKSIKGVMHGEIRTDRADDNIIVEKQP